MEIHAKRQDRLLEFHLVEMMPYIRKVAKKKTFRNSLHAPEDIIQEATVVLWKILNKYPDVTKTELVKIFRTSLTHRLASLYRKAGRKTDSKLTSLDILMEGSYFRGGESQIKYVDKAPQLCRDVRPWTWYEESLHTLARQIGKDRLSWLVQGPRQGRDIELLKEEVLTNM